MLIIVSVWQTHGGLCSFPPFCLSMFSNLTYYFCNIKLKTKNKILIQIKLDTFLQSVLYLCSASEFIKLCLCALLNSYTNSMYLHFIKMETEAIDG